MDDVDQLLEAMACLGSVTDVIIDDNRRRHVSILLSERGTWNLDSVTGSASDNLMHHKEGRYRGRLLKRTIKRSKSVMDMFLSTMESKDVTSEHYKAKNIKQVRLFCFIKGSF